MSDFKSRILTEKVELDEKIDKLSTFILSEKFTELPSETQKALLKFQQAAMEAYSRVLELRLEDLK